MGNRRDNEPDSSECNHAHAEPTEVIFNNFLPPNFAAFKNAIKPWAAEASAASGGTMNITIPTSSMAPFPRLWDIVQDRVVDMGIVPLGTNDQNISLPSLLNRKRVFGANGPSPMGNTLRPQENTKNKASYRLPFSLSEATSSFHAKNRLIASMISKV
ncbi:MAG: hypothetical protein COB84_07405 [Rhodobacteraceae bacterium]|nr:MAG: hypothetical protein COB84_07405 [Paracoccaceae bacterium]